MPSLLEAIQVTKGSGAPGRYDAHVSSEWNAPIYPSGGVTTAIALRAMETELAVPELRLRTFSTMFVSTVAGGRVVVDVERIRLGRRMSHLRATVRNGAEGAGHVVTAAFGEIRDGFDFTYSTMPDVAMPEECEPMPDPPPGVPRWRSSFFDNIELRRVRSYAAFETGWEGGRAEALRWMRYKVSPRREDGSIDPLTLVGLADTMPPAIAQYIGPGYPIFHAPSVDLSMRFFADTKEEWVLVKALAHHAGDGYASAEVTIWDRTGALLANGAQLMLLRFPDPADLGMSSEPATETT
jgi:acyl-CoA thioesterase